MADPVVRIRRSSVSGKIPTTGQLRLGELALNTTDGKLFTERESGGVGVGTTVITLNPWNVGLGSDTYDIHFIAGSVGIGTDDPTENLDINGDIRIRGGLYDFFNNIGGNGELLTSTGAGVSWTNTATTPAGQSIVEQQASTPYYITASDVTLGVSTAGFIDTTIVSKDGRIGIGTDDPTTLLDIRSTNALESNFLTLGADRNNADTEVGILFKDRNVIGGLQNAARINSLREGSAGNFSLVFSTSVSPANATEKLRITSAGNVGINSTAPIATLDVNGTLNVSGVSTFQSNVNLGDNDRLIFGDGQDLRIFHDGTDDFIFSNSSSLKIAGSRVVINNAANTENQAVFTQNGAVELYYDNSKKFETTGAGVTVFGTTESQQLVVSGFSTLGVTTFTGVVSFGTSAYFGDDDTLNFGDSQDLQIYHDGSHSFITDVGAGNLYIGADQNIILSNPSASEFYATFNNNGAVELYYDNSKKFETTDAGVTVFGTTESQQLVVSGVSTFNDLLDINGDINIDGSQITYTSSSNELKFADDAQLRFGGGNDLRIYHSSGASFIQDAGSGSLFVETDGSGIRLRKISGSENLANFYVDGAVELYYDNSKKFETTGAGATIFGRLDVDELDIGTGVAVTTILDEDNMVSDSDTALATQQSIKAYVDNQLSGANLDFTGDTGSGSIVLDTETFDISGTLNEIETVGSGNTITIGLPNDVTIGQDLTVTRDVNILRNLDVIGNITVGGTSATIFTQTLQVEDPDIVLGIRTDAFGNDASTDNTANHGGIAIASTEGNPLVSLNIAGIETLPPTYKKIMWFKSGSFAGLATDAWLTNYAFGIGTTSMSNGTRLAVGNIEFNDDDITSITNINATGIITASSFSGDGASVTNVDAETLDGLDSTQFLRSDDADIKTSGNLTFNDNVKANFGTSNDLGIYHTGANSFIDKTGTGDIYIRNLTDDRDVIIQSDDGAGGTATYIRADGSSGEVQLSYYNSQRLRTTATGIDVAGLTDTDTLNVSGVSTFVGDISIADKIVHTGDTNTAIRFPANDTFTVETAGAERLRVTSAGNVGIGTDNPTANLEIEKPTSASLEVGNTLGQRVRIEGGSSGISFNTPNVLNMTFGTSNTERLRITDIGRVGINTDAPSQTLDVNGNVRFRNALYDNTNSDGDPNQILSSTGSGIEWITPSSAASGTEILLQQASTPYYITASDVTSGVSTAGFIDTTIVAKDGRIGIGITDPTELLDVDGDALINGVTVGTGGGDLVSNAALGLNALTSNTTGASNIAIGTSALSSNSTGNNNVAVGRNAGRFVTGDDNTLVGYISGNSVSTGEKNIFLGFGAGAQVTTGSNNTIIGDIDGSASLSDTVIIAAGLNERLRIDSNGNMGIGTDNPGDKLHVSTASFGGALIERTTAGGGVKLDLKNGNGNVRNIVNDSSGILQLQYNSSNQVVVNQSGDVGINSTSPTEKLDVVGNIVAKEQNPYIKIQAGTNGSPYLRFEQDATRRAFLRYQNIGQFDIVNEYGDVTFWTGTSGSETQKMIVTSSGNVGINSTAPTAKLDVNGDVSIASTVSIGTTINIVPYNNLGTLSFEGSAGQLFSITNNLTSGSIFAVNDVSGIPSIDVDADGTIQLAPFGASEYVGIGLTNPTQKLDVNGDVRFRGAIYDNNNVVGTANSILTSTGSGVVWADITSIPVGDANTLDGLDSTQFLRSDVADTKTGITTFSDDLIIADKISHEGDTDTAIRFPAADTFTVETAGSERVRVDSSGNFGIGASSVDALLHVSKSTGAEIRIDTGGGTNADSVLGFRENGVDRAKIYWDGADNDLYLETTIGDFCINPAGNVGIGTDNPDFKLHILTNATGGDGIFVDDNSISQASPYIRVRGRRIDGNTSQSFSGSLVLEKWRGDAASSTNQHLGSIIFGGNYSTAPTTTTGMTYGASISAIAEGAFSNINTAPTAIIFRTGTVGLGTLGLANVAYGGGESLRITSNKNILIGTTSETGTASQKLQVTGGAYVSGDVGIGLTNPTAKLDVLDNDIQILVGDISEGTDTTDGGVRFNGIGTTIQSAIFTEVNGEILSYGINVGQISTTGYSTDRVGGIFRLDTRTGSDFGDSNNFVVKGRSIGTTVEHNSIVINLNTGETSLSPDKGNVGLGTNSASQLLDVNGNARFRGAIYDNNNAVGAANSILTSTGSGVVWADITTIPVGDAATLDGLDSTQFLRSDADDTKTGITTFNDDAYFGGQIYLTDTLGGYEKLEIASNDVRFIGKHLHSEFGVWCRSSSTQGDRTTGMEALSDELRLYSNSVEQVRIDTTGQVGIGTDDPTEKLDVRGSIAVNETTVTGSATASLSTLIQNSIHTLPTATYRSVEYTIQATQGTNFHATKILALHNGTTAYHSEYGTIFNNSSVAAFDVDISGGNIRLLATSAVALQTDYVINFVATKL